MIIIVFLEYNTDSSEWRSIFPFNTTVFELQLDSTLHSIFIWNNNSETGYYSLGFAKNSNEEMVYMEPDPSNGRIRTTSKECFCFQEEPTLADKYLLSLNIGWDLIIKAREELEEK